MNNIEFCIVYLVSTINLYLSKLTNLRQNKLSTFGNGNCMVVNTAEYCIADCGCGTAGEVGKVSHQAENEMRTGILII